MEKLINIQNLLNAPKNQRNTFGGYNYRSAEDILEALKPLLKANNCALTLKDEIVFIGDKDDARFYIKATATLYDDKGAEITSTVAYAREPLTKKGMDEAQITGTASSYARKYALNGLFCIDDNKDADTDEYTNQTNNAPKPTVDEIVAGMAKMTLDNWRAFYKRAIELYPKDSPEYKLWVKAWIAKKDELESAKTTDNLQADSNYINNM